MDYEVDKKSFYEMLTEVFNNIYGDDYVILGGEQFKVCDVVDNKFYHLQKQEFYLEDIYGRKLFETVEIVDAKRIGNYKEFKEKVIGNHSFKVDLSKNEILELIYPYILEYPFLDMIPVIIDKIVLNRHEENKYYFTKEEIEAISKVFKEYYEKDKINRDNTICKVMTRVKENKE